MALGGVPLSFLGVSLTEQGLICTTVGWLRWWDRLEILILMLILICGPVLETRRGAL